MHNEFTAIVERDGKWFIAYCPEIPGANGQGRTKEECLANLRDAIDLILDDRRKDGLRGIPENAERIVVSVERSDRNLLSILENMGVILSGKENPILSGAIHRPATLKQFPGILKFQIN